MYHFLLESLCMAPDPTKKKRSIHQEKSNHKSEESGSGNPENTRVKNFVLVREQKKSRAKTKKISRHVLRSHTPQNRRTIVSCAIKY